uniref:ubiquitinyl hydrolase 1 n=1 Tax=Ditylenchus dipsaci TaxID=166011 RepID=A0A915CV49_9BILA
MNEGGSGTSVGTNTENSAQNQIIDNEHQMYLRSQQHLQEIEDEVRQTQPLDSPEYFKKANELAGSYSHIRKIRGDGNCFYRAVLTAQLERCFQDKAELARLTTLCKGWRQKLFDFGFPELTTDGRAIGVTSANGSKAHENGLQMLFDDLNVDGIANYYVAFLRLICSGYLRENEVIFSGFIEGGRTLDQFCKDEIEPMWKECDHICIIALVNAIQVPIRIEYMDQTQAPNGGWHHDFTPDFVAEGSDAPKLFFLYRPGHYDILYPETS